ncbi:MAG: ParB/RepB/Spo0J family partition protein [Oscillospiraceae bacterium]|nr:ParB/RepB/Spo0J family partition protein [Oscillospiraceae bacterium]
MAMPFKSALLENIGGIILNEKTAARVVMLDMDRIYPNPNQPRTRFNDAELEELAQSIKNNGLIQPIIVRRLDIGYELIAGERRMRAARLCGMTEISCIIVDANERSSAMMSLAENMQRKDLNFFEEAEAISAMTQLFGFTQEDVALRLGKSQSTIANKVRLLKFSRAERRKMIEYGFTERHARALLSVDSPDIRADLIEEIYERKLNVENTERLIDSMTRRNKELQRIRKCRGAFKDVRLFVNTINHAIEVMQAAGINAEVKKTKEKDYIEYVVRIPSNN